MHARYAAGLWCALAAPLALAIEPGGIDLRVEGNRFWLETRDAPLPAVVAELDAAVPPVLKTRNLSDRRVTVRFQGVTLEDILQRLEVNYVLEYLPATAAAGPRLVGGGLSATGEAGEFAGWLVPGMAPEYLLEMRLLLTELRDDDIRGNAQEAMYEFMEEGATAFPVLEQALLSEDYQTRQFAAQILAGHGWTDTGYVPSPRFLAVLIEGMQDDAYPYETRADGGWVYSGVRNASGAYEWFLKHPEQIERAEPLLLQAIERGDGQQRFLAAVLLAEATRTAQAERIVKVLVPHLADNLLLSDGKVAASALGRLGPVAWPYLQAYRQSGDTQQREFVEAILQGNVEERPHLHMLDWAESLFPDRQGRYRQ